MTTKPSLREIKAAVQAYEEAMHSWDVMFENGDIDPIERERTYGIRVEFEQNAPDYLKALLPVIEAAAVVAEWRYSITCDGCEDEWIKFIEALEAIKAVK